MPLMLFLGISYLIGALPIGYLIARWYGIKDIRTHGSGTIGATNVARVLGPPYFFLVFFLDAAKAYSTLWFVGQKGLQGSALLLCAAALLIGNAFSIFLQFSGGKNISTLVGSLYFLKPPVLLIFLVTWLGFFVVRRSAGMASVVALSSILFHVVFLYSFDTEFRLFCVGAVLLGMYLHRDHIKKF